MSDKNNGAAQVRPQISSKITTILLVTVIVLAIVGIVGVVLWENKNVVTTQTSTEPVSQYKGQQIYFFAEFLSDSDYSAYMCEEGTELYNQVVQLNHQLASATDGVLYLSQDVQPLELASLEPFGGAIPKEFLDGYSEYLPEDYYPEEYGYVSTMSATQAFYDTFGFCVTKGRSFASNDYCLADGAAVPVLLGSAYEDYYHIGDTFTARYYYETITCEVIGFVEAGTKFLSRASTTYVGADYYVFLPMQESAEGTEIEFADRASSLNALGGIALSSLDEATTQTQFQKLLEAAGLSDWDVQIKAR